MYLYIRRCCWIYIYKHIYKNIILYTNNSQLKMLLIGEYDSPKCCNEKEMKYIERETIAG